MTDKFVDEGYHEWFIVRAECDVWDLSQPIRKSSEQEQQFQKGMYII